MQGLNTESTACAESFCGWRRSLESSEETFRLGRRTLQLQRGIYVGRKSYC